MEANEAPKYTLQKDESSEDYRRASDFFKPRTRPNECDMDEQSQQICAMSDSGNEPQEAENMDVEETTTHDEENQEVVEGVENPTQIIGPDSEDISLSNDNPLTTNTLNTPVGKKHRKKKAPGPFQKKDVKKWKKTYPFMQFDIESQSFQCGVY